MDFGWFQVAVQFLFGRDFSRTGTAAVYPLSQETNASIAVVVIPKASDSSRIQEKTARALDDMTELGCAFRPSRKQTASPDFLLVRGTSEWKRPLVLSATVLLSSYVIRIPAMWRQAPVTAAIIIAACSGGVGGLFALLSGLEFNELAPPVAMK